MRYLCCLRSSSSRSLPRGSGSRVGTNSHSQARLDSVKPVVRATSVVQGAESATQTAGELPALGLPAQRESRAPPAYSLLPAHADKHGRGTGDDAVAYLEGAHSSPAGCLMSLTPDVEMRDRPRLRIPAAVRRAVWLTYCGKVLEGRCYCCRQAISCRRWHCAHVVADKLGGLPVAEHLRPTCPQVQLGDGGRGTWKSGAGGRCRWSSSWMSWRCSLPKDIEASFGSCSS